MSIATPSRPRIFISHSTKEPVGREYRDALAQRLTDAGYPVLLDKDIDLNQDWRPLLNAWIGGCDAAVLLISEAALASRYVAYEASLLAYRHRSEQGRFQLISVIIPPVTADRVDASPLGVSGVTEIQAIHQNVPRDEAIQRVVDYLDQHARSPDSPAERHAERLSWLLSKVDPRELERAAKAVVGTWGPWTPGLELPMKAALAFMEAGLERAPKGVRYVRAQFPRPTDLDDTVTLIATSWVDCRSAAEIPSVVERGGLLGLLNGEKTKTAWLYVVGACPIPPGDAWKVAKVDGVMGSKGIENLKERIREALAHELKAPSPTPEEVQKAVRVYTDEHEPVFVALPFQGLNPPAVQELRKEFPSITFFFLLGSNASDMELARQANVELLQPPLEPGTEQPFWELFKRKSDYLKAP